MNHQICLRLGLLLISIGGLHSALCAEFRFSPTDAKSLTLWEGDKPVYVYNHGVISKEAVPADRARSSYIHPLYGMDGEVLTDDFPKDHYHHRGLFWAWPHVKIGAREYDLWMLKGIEHKFDKWLGQNAQENRAVLKLRNYWVAGGRNVVRELVEITAHRAEQDSRAIDLAFTWTPLEQPVTLAGAEGKSYGGLTLRFAPGTNTVITTPLGTDEKDLPMTKLPWADLTAKYPGVSEPSGAAIFISPDHPDFPPMWLTRHYGVLCVGWPGVNAQTFPPGKDIVCRHRVWVHKGSVTAKEVEQAWSQWSSEIQRSKETRRKP